MVPKVAVLSKDLVFRAEAEDLSQDSDLMSRQGEAKGSCFVTTEDTLRNLRTARQPEAEVTRAGSSAGSALTMQ
jgi:hypothetical protein